MQTTLANARKEAGFSTQEQFAEHIGVPRSTLAKWESGISKPRMAMIPVLAKVLNKTEGEIIHAVTDNPDKTA